MKIIIDTDVLLSALFSRRGASYRVIKWLTEEYHVHAKQYNSISNTQIIEFSDVLTRERNLARAQLTREDAEAFIDAFSLISFHQKINFLWRPFLKDIDDDMVLEVAFNSNAKYIITHNIKDFQGVNDKFNIEVITPQIFLKKIGEIK